MEVDSSLQNTSTEPEPFVWPPVASTSRLKRQLSDDDAPPPKRQKPFDLQALGLALVLRRPGGKEKEQDEEEQRIDVNPAWLESRPQKPMLVPLPSRNNALILYRPLLPELKVEELSDGETAEEGPRRRRRNANEAEVTEPEGSPRRAAGSLTVEELPAPISSSSSSDGDGDEMEIDG